MHWLIAIQLLSGILFARRTLQKLSDKNLIDARNLAKLRASVFFALFGTTFLLRKHPIGQIFAESMVCSVLLVTDSLFQYRLKSRIQSEFPDFLNKVILAMKTGMSFRAAIERSFSSKPALWENWLRGMIESRVFLRPAEPLIVNRPAHWWHDYFDELAKVYENPHTGLARLENFRAKLKILSEFRRKSGQALLQARIQLAVMTVLYFALLLLTMGQNEAREHFHLISASLALFFAGQFVFFKIARKSKWKI